MGGGTSNLFYGTKGSRKEYQYSLFTDEDSAKLNSRMTAGLEDIVSEKPHKTSCIQRISASDIIKKCHEYYDEKLTAQQFIDWLKYITSDISYCMEDKLRSLIETTLKKFLQFPTKDRENFTLQMHIFENFLKQLL